MGYPTDAQFEEARSHRAPPRSKTQGVLAEVLAERQRQEAKWGEQNHPDFDQTLLTRPGGCDEERMAMQYEVPTEARGKQLCQGAFEKKQGTYAHILVEEVAEAVGACNAPPAKLREELIQVAAVAVAWVEKLDREAARTSTAVSSSP